MPIVIHYNPNLKNYAQENRQTETMSEKMFWNIVRNNKLNGLKFYRQKIVGEYIVDFICSDTGIVIEIDGDSHNEKMTYDKKRDSYGWNTFVDADSTSYMYGNPDIQTDYIDISGLYYDKHGTQVISVGFGTSWSQDGLMDVI